MDEQRLIDANALMDRMQRKTSGVADKRFTEGFNDAVARFRSMIHGAPTIDAAPVVRCMECKHRGDTYKCPMRRLVLPLDGAGHYEDFTEDDGYCHRGERRVQ